MRDLKVAVRYAGALLTSAREQGVVEGVGESYAAMLQVMEGNRDLRTFMDSPQVAEQEKKDLVKSVFGDHVESVLLHFVYLLVDKNRIENFRDIGEKYAALVEAEKGVVRAQVVTAITLSDDLSEQLNAKLAARTGKTIILEKRVDPAVVGGVKVTLGDYVLDGTVRTNLDQLKKTLGKTTVRFSD
ncbi:MAG: F0F1 ATP synthase subunit delta [bacterium]|nr:F0F1 ATP synthase subunit delta [bacterium]